MSGKHAGVQAQFRQLHPKAVYIHCCGHQLNLVLCNTCKAIQELVEFFDLLESLYTCLSTSLVNHEKYKEIGRKILDVNPTELVQLSATRWACQVKSVKSVKVNIPVLLKTLPELKTTTSAGLLNKLCKPAMIYCLFMMDKLLSTTQTLHVYLQAVNVDLSQVLEYKDAVINTLKDMRSTATADAIYKQAEACMKDNNIEIKTGRNKKRRVMDDFIMTETSGIRDEITDADSLKTRLFYPAVDRMVSELRSRFSVQNDVLYRGIHACNPAASTFLDLQYLESFAAHYKLNVQEQELYVAKNFVKALQQKEKDTITMQKMYQLLDPMMFPSLKKIVQVALTIPVTSCSCERSFSALRRLKTWLRGRMTDERLDDMAVLSIEKSTYAACSDDELVSAFMTMKPRR